LTLHRKILASVVVVGSVFALGGVCAVAQQEQSAQITHKDEPIGALGLGWTYLYADVGGGERESLNGWYARPSINIPHHMEVFADFTNYYGTTKKGSLNSHGETFGLGYQYLRTKKLKSEFFGETGNVRSSNAGVTNQFAFASGVNFAFPIGKGVSFTMTPAEWVFLYPKGDPRNDYNAKVGISIALGHHRS
jgi:hypothetical protein